MPRRIEPYTKDDISVFVAKAARLLAGRYDAYGVTHADLIQEMWAWAVEHDDRIERWLAKSPQQTTRIFRSLYDHGRDYAEGEKAERVGYKSDDVFWYSPSLVTSILPFALDPEWEGFVNGEMDDNILTMVMDVRTAIDKTSTQVTLLMSSEGDDLFESAVQIVVDYLGGNRAYVGRRRVMTNSRARSLTDWDGEQ